MSEEFKGILKDHPNSLFPDSTKDLNYNRELVESWTPSGYLNSVKGYWKKLCMALILENQRLMIETMSVEAEVKTKLLELTINVYNNILAWDIVSVQPMPAPRGLAYYLDEKDSNLIINTEEMIAKTRRFNRPVAKDFGPKDLSFSIIDDINNEILTDLLNNCGTVSCVNLDVEETERLPRLRECIFNLKKELGNKDGKIGRFKPKWIVVNGELYHTYKAAFDDTGLKIHLYDIEEILIGFKGESYMECGYVYSPYVPFTFTPSIKNDKYFLLNRYGKKLVPGGSVGYGKIKVLKKEVCEC